jgi:hypothetical protein
MTQNQLGEQLLRCTAQYLVDLNLVTSVTEETLKARYKLTQLEFVSLWRINMM